VFVTLVRVLALIEITWMVLMIGGMVHVFGTDRMVSMGQAIDGVFRRSKCHGYGWRHEGEHSESGHRDRDAEADTPP